MFAMVDQEENTLVLMPETNIESDQLDFDYSALLTLSIPLLNANSTLALRRNKKGQVDKLTIYLKDKLKETRNDLCTASN